MWCKIYLDQGGTKKCIPGQGNDNSRTRDHIPHTFAYIIDFIHAGGTGTAIQVKQRSHSTYLCIHHRLYPRRRYRNRDTGRHQGHLLTHKGARILFKALPTELSIKGIWHDRKKGTVCIVTVHKQWSHRCSNSFHLELQPEKTSVCKAAEAYT